MSLISIQNLKIHYRLPDKVFKAVDGVNLDVKEGTILGLVGESGCGKTTLMKGVMQIMARNAFFDSGDILYDGKSMLDLSPSEHRSILWQDIAMIPQASMDSLNPVYPVSDAFIEVLTLKAGMNKKDAIKRTKELFELVGINKERIHNYPHEFSGGMKQRVAIALALCLNPKVIIADEPVTALDVIVQHQILTTLKRLQKELGLTIILITHDISVVAQTCDELAVMYAGKIVEKGKTADILNNPVHPYSMGLSNAFPNLLKDDKLISIDGNVPDLSEDIPGCLFANRCPFVQEICHVQQPEMITIENERKVACHRTDDFKEMQQLAEETSTWEKMIT